MHKFRRYRQISLLGVCLAVASCKVPAIVQQRENKSVPQSYNNNRDTTTMSTIQWRSFFTDKNLVDLIDTALKNNQELMITLQEIEIARNDIRFKQGPLSPTVGAKLGAGVEKVGRYTSQGAGDASTEIEPGKEVPDPLMDYTAAVFANWEVDIWKKLHNAKKAAVTKYLATVEGKNFVLTSLIAEVANSYYELLALDNQLEIIKQNIELQKNALGILKVQKEAARATELAVQKFQAEVLNSQSLEFEVLQKIKETENRINFLLGRYPKEILRDKNSFLSAVPGTVRSGIPSQLLANRPDIKKAELELVAAKLDVKVARAEFYPSFGISAAFGLQAFKPSYLVKFPESILYSLAGDIAGPLINKKGIKAEFNNANARQLQSMYNYERTILNAYLEVSTQLSKIDNLEQRYDLKSKEVAALTRSIGVSNDLFKSARADYLEVLMTQRDALASKLELIETKKEQLNAVTNVYRDLGGGWK
ncbi:TolC family protein [Olivibacter domesticus]|uniref:Efflux transporter, outer membrane factor (OMF) lipoprotein, NodT family n=1 Tax=Olivibacter domesticus TaxID=407022 RepID=A0A1H7S8D5_OLID1|nr:TolC family protein [Olivibacter domesticus]SEL68733.1 efflux transporter, outer membrane factor (OMF) lipoprotein, NodT family [Olivibacter domesticus]